MEACGQTQNFGWALSALKDGNKKVARKGWNGKGMSVRLFTPVSTYHLPYIEMTTADKKIVPWLASQTDILAEDWVIVD